MGVCVCVHQVTARDGYTGQCGNEGLISPYFPGLG